MPTQKGEGPVKAEIMAGRALPKSAKAGQSPVRPKRRSRETREAIMAESKELFAKKGYDDVSVRDIANAAGISIPAIYLYFKDKRQLYMECCVEVFQRGTSALAAAMAGDEEPYPRLQRIVRTLMDVLLQDPHLAALFQWELATRDIEGLSLLEEAAFRDTISELQTLVYDATGREVGRIDIVAIFALAIGLIQYGNVGLAIEVPEGRTRSEYLADFIFEKMVPRPLGR